jgi:hypothetical protein
MAAQYKCKLIKHTSGTEKDVGKPENFVMEILPAPGNVPDFQPTYFLFTSVLLPQRKRPVLQNKPNF